MAEQFYTILTQTGREKLVAAVATAGTIRLETMALGSGENEAYYEPTEAQTILKNEVWRGDLSSLKVSPDNPGWMIAEAVVLADVGGFWVREVGIFDADGDLIAVGKMPETYKPRYQDGTTKDLWIRVYMEAANTSAVTLNIDPSLAVATQQSVVNAIESHVAEANPHPQYAKEQAMKGTRYATLDLGESGTVNQVYDYSAAAVFVSTVTGDHAIQFANFPDSGDMGRMHVFLINGGMFNLIWPVGINWALQNGMTSDNFTDLMASYGRSLMPRGTDQFEFWSLDGGVTVYGKLICSTYFVNTIPIGDAVIGDGFEVG